MSLLSGRCVEGSVEGGEKTASTAGVLGGRESRTISAVGIGSGMGGGASSGAALRVMFSRGRLRGLGAGFSGFSGLDWSEERCFLGDKTGSVLTGSIRISSASRENYEKLTR